MDRISQLLEAIDGLQDWPEKVRLMQTNWIGRSEGLQFRFAIAANDLVDATELTVELSVDSDAALGARDLIVTPSSGTAGTSDDAVLRVRVGTPWDWRQQVDLTDFAAQRNF